MQELKEDASRLASVAMDYLWCFAREGTVFLPQDTIPPYQVLNVTYFFNDSPIGGVRWSRFDGHEYCLINRDHEITESQLCSSQV